MHATDEQRDIGPSQSAPYTVWVQRDALIKVVEENRGRDINVDLVTFA